MIPGSETRIDPLTAVVDGYPELTHRLETSVGGEPLEEGRQATDHAVARQAQLTLTGLVSDFNGGTRPSEAWETLRELHRDATVMTVITELTVYREMLIRRVEAPQRFRGLRFELELEEIIRVGADALEIGSMAVMSALADGAVADTVAAGAGQADKSLLAADNLRKAAQVTRALARTTSNPALNALARTAEGASSLMTERALAMAGTAAGGAGAPLGTLTAENDGLRTALRGASTAANALIAQSPELGGVGSELNRAITRADALETAIAAAQTQNVAVHRTAEVDRGRVSLPTVA